MKYLMVLIVIVVVVIIYALMAAEQPVINQLVATANASGNFTGFEDAQAVMTSFPIYMWGLPGFCGIIAIIFFLKYWPGPQQS